VNRSAFVAASFLSLFLEVLLIRWCGAEIRILAYLKNLTLLGCFLGLGLGYAAAGRRRLPIAVSFVPVVLLLLLAHPALEHARYPNLRSLSVLLNFSDWNSWRQESSDALKLALGLGLVSAVYGLLALAFVPLGQALGAHFASVPPEQRVRAYSVNVLASLAGTIAFGTLSLLEAPPWVWFALASGAAVLAAEKSRDRIACVGLAALTLTLLVNSERSTPILEGDVMPVAKTRQEIKETRWSPYQKIQLVEETYEFPGHSWTDWSAYVNGHWYSRVATADLDEAKRRADVSKTPAAYDPQAALRLPYKLAKGRGRVLLLGAGMGRDAATALAEGMGEVDCVEIEPRFIAWGKELHPQKPYSDPKVHVHVDDARRFLRNAPAGRYDLVVFCYLDSHALTSNFTNTNLDSYVYTSESLAEAKRLLAPEGVLALGFWSPRAFIYRRVEALLEQTFGSPPFRLKESLFLHGLEPPDALRARIAQDPYLRANLTRPARLEGPTPPVTTDDWPFFYLESASVPWLVRTVLIAVALLSAIGVSGAIGRVTRIDAHFLLLGAAFMLVETWAISRASLVYGATWYVSSAVIASLLVAVLIANARVERRGPVSLRWAFPGLFATLVLATLVDPSRLLDLPRAAQLAIAAPVYALPFVFASAIFASSFQKAARPDEALASNLLGSVLGGALETLSYALGLKALGFVAFGLYALAWAAARERKPQA
jgi:SAM-dependent methyltransferase